MPPLIGFFIDLSGIDHFSYARPRVPLGAGFSSIDLPEHEPVLFVDVTANIPVQTVSVFMAPAVFTKLTGKSSAAYNVGYASLSHFTKTFRKEFGVNPKACGAPSN